MKTLSKKFTNIKPYIICFTAALFFAFELMQLHMMNAISPMVMQEFGLNAKDFGLLSSTYLLADVIFLVPAGLILDRFSTRKIVLLALVLCVLGTFGFALSTSFASACFCHFISGIGNAFCFLSCIKLISMWIKKSQQAFVTSLVITIGMFGGFIAQTPFSALAAMLTWRKALLADGGLGMIILILAAVFVHDKKSVSKPSSINFSSLIANLKKCFFNKQNLSCGLYISLMNMPLMVVGAVYGSLFLTQTHNISLTESSFIVSMICVGTIIGSPLYGFVADKLSVKKPLMMFGSISSILIFGIILYLPVASVVTLSALFLALGISTSSQVLGYPLITTSAKKDLTATSTSVAAVIIMGLPMFVGPMIGKIIDLFSISNNIDRSITFLPDAFTNSFLIIPFGFFIALSLVHLIKEEKKRIYSS